MTTKAQMKATAKYNAKAYDRIEIKVKKGEKQVITDYAKSKGQSVNAYITGLIQKDMESGD